MKIVFILLLTFLIVPELFAQHLIYLDGEGNGPPTLVDRPDGSKEIQTVSHPLLRVFPPMGGLPSRGIVLIAPGGGYHILAITKEGYDVASRLSQEGYTGVVLHYRLGHDGKPDANGTPVPQQDGLSALRIIRQRIDAGTFPDVPVSLIGFSAGGHLAATLTQLAPAADRPDATALIYPVITMVDSFGHRGSALNLLGEDADEARLLRFSPEKHVTADHPPTLLIHAEDDGGVPVKNSLVYRDALREAGVAVTTLLLETGGHGFGIRGDLGWFEVYLKFLERNSLKSE